MTEATALSIPDRFGHVDTWVFDLDNTLYPPHCDLWPKIDMQITRFMCEMFGLDGMSSRALQKYYYLQLRHDDARAYRGIRHFDPEAYLDFRARYRPLFHRARHFRWRRPSAICPDEKYIFTNGSQSHAEKTVESLGLSGLFDGICDIAATGLVPKPKAEAYESCFALLGIDPARAAIFEDIERNLCVPHARGMTTVLVTPKQGAHDHREDWEILRGQPDHVHFVTDDLAGFLRGLPRSASRSTNRSVPAQKLHAVVNTVNDKRITGIEAFSFRGVHHIKNNQGADLGVFSVGGKKRTGLNDFVCRVGSQIGPVCIVMRLAFGILADAIVSHSANQHVTGTPQPRPSGIVNKSIWFRQ